MKPLITTLRALRELATGLSPDAVTSSPVLFLHEASSASVLVSSFDHIESQRITIMREANSRDAYVPDALVERRRDALSRIASFAEYARTMPLSLPRGWSQYKHDGMISFFAVPGTHSESVRWVAEVLAGGRSDVVIWRTVMPNKRPSLEDFDVQRNGLAFDLDGQWNEAIAASEEAFAATRRPDHLDVDMYLSPMIQSRPTVRTYHAWLESVSADQRAFLEAATSRSIRLRGPAGSGKTLALTLKAIREILVARTEDLDLRVLVVTHSWALASQISDSIDNMGVGVLPELDTFPLLEIAQALLPQDKYGSPQVSLVGSDSFSGKRAQLDEISEIVQDFVTSDWVTYRSGASASLTQRLDSDSERDRLALSWDLLLEFGSVIGAAAIFPGAGAERRYSQLPRDSWMFPLEGVGDLRVVFALYVRFMDSLESRSLVTSDQVLADFLSYLETHAWNRNRRSQGYDLVFVDEFHLFSPLERQVLHLLTRDVASYPRVFMAADPRQSASEAFIGTAAAETRSSPFGGGEDAFGDVDSFELTTVHRFTPQILELVKHLHLEFPTYDLGSEWHIDFATAESSQADGPTPALVESASSSGQDIDLYKAVQELYSKGRIAIAVVDVRQWRRFSDLAAQISESGRFNVSTITGRSDIEGIGYRRRGLVVAPAEYLAGLQFDSVLVAGIPDLQHNVGTANERTRMLSLLYLAISRAEREVRIYENEEDGGAIEVLQRAAANGLIKPVAGSLV